jgi:hypothetical protein
VECFLTFKLSSGELANNHTTRLKHPSKEAVKIDMHLSCLIFEDLHCACQLLLSTLPSKTMGTVDLKSLAAAVTFQPHEGCEDSGRNCKRLHCVER